MDAWSNGLSTIDGHGVYHMISRATTTIRRERTWRDCSSIQDRLVGIVQFRYRRTWYGQDFATN